MNIQHPLLAASAIYSVIYANKKCFLKGMHTRQKLFASQRCNFIVSYLTTSLSLIDIISWKRSNSWNIVKSML